MLRKVASKVAWVGRTASMVFGLALVLALVIGAATTALAHSGVDTKLFHLGHSNVATAITSLGGRLGVNGPMLAITNNNAGANDTALALNVQAGEAPLKVKSSAGTATNLSADKLDGKDSTEIGINGYERIRVQSAFDSTTHKSLTARCTSGREVIGGGAYVFPSLSDGSRDSAPIAIRANSPDLNGLESWRAEANEVEPYSFSWTLYAIVICAKVGP